MDTNDAGPTYQIWGPDYTAYGPVELPTLVNWVKEERVIADSWIFVTETQAWVKASRIPELKMFFQRRTKSTDELDAKAWDDGSPEIKPGALRRIKIFAALGDEELAAFLRYMEIIAMPPFKHVVRKGDPGDAMYLVLEGELRSCLIVDGKESPVANLTAGSIFGEVSLLDQGPHAADVISNSECVLIKISEATFKKVVQEAPELILPFLLALSRSIAGRVRTLTRRYEDSVHLAQIAEVA